MAQKIQLPDGTFFPMKQGETPEQALMVAAGLYPDAFAPKPAAEAGPKSGGIAALKAGASNLKSDIATLLGRTGAIAPETAERVIEEEKQYRAKTFKPTETFSEAPLTKFSELLGGSVPYMAAPLAAGVAAATLPVSGTAATVAGLGAAGTASYTQFLGSFLSRQMDTGKKLGETELGTAALAALPAAALDTVSLRMIPGIRGILGAAGREVTEAQAKEIAQQGLGRTLGDYVAKSGKVAGVEGLTESAQQVLERMQAGLNITDAEARKEYFDSFLGGAILGGTLAVPGRAIERGKIKTQAEQIEQREKDAAKKAAAQAKEAERAAEELRKQDPQYMRDAVAQSAALEQQKRDLLAQIAKPAKGERLTEEQKQANTTISAQLKELQPKLAEAAKESNRVKPLLAKIEEEARVAGMSPEEFFAERALTAPGITPAAARPIEGDPFAGVAPVAPTEPVISYAQQIKALADAQSITPPEVQDYAAYAMTNPVMAAEMVKTRTPMPGMKRKEAAAFLDGLELQLQELADQRAAAGQAATGAAQQRLSVVEAEEQAALEENQRQQAALDAEAERNRKIAPEILAQRRIAARPAVGVAGLINQLPLDIPVAPTTQAGSSVMGRTSQELRGLPIGAEGEPIYTAEEEKAPEATPVAAPRRVVGGFRLFNAQGEPQRPSDYASISQRIARALAREDLDQDAYNFLRRAEKVLPTYDQKIETARETYTPAGGVTPRARKDVASTEGFLTLLDQQLSRIEKGQEGVVSPEVVGQRPVTYQGFPVTGARAEAAAPTMADLRDIQKNASADPKTLSAIQRKRAESYYRYINEGKSPAQAAGYAYRDSVAQPEGERLAVEAGEIPRTKRGKEATGRTLTFGRAAAPTPLSLRKELEPLLRQAEKEAAPKRAPKGQRQLQLFRAPRVTKPAEAAAPAVEEKISENERRRREAAVAATEAEAQRTDKRKAEQRRLEQLFADTVDRQEVSAITAAQREAREMGAPTFSLVDLGNMEKNPVQVLGGYRSAVTAVEKEVRFAQERSKQARLRQLDGLKATVNSLEEKYRAAKTSAERAELIPKIDAATADYATRAATLNAQSLTWRGMSSQIKRLADLYNKIDFLEAKIGPGGEFAAAVLEDQKQFRALLNKEARAARAKAVAEKQAAEKKAAAEATARAAAAQAKAPTTSGEALTRTEAAKARKQQKTVFGTPGIGAEVAAKEAEAIKTREIVDRTQADIEAKQARGEELTDIEKNILAQGAAKAKAEATEKLVGPEGAAVIKEQVAKLTPDEVAKLEEAYGVTKRSKKFLAQLNNDLVDMVNNGGKAVAKAIKSIIKKMAEGVLAVAVFFNPSFDPKGFTFDLPQAYATTITQTAEIKEAVPADARAKMSPLAQAVYENMAPVAKKSGKGFIVADKPNGMLHFFNADGSVLVQDTALYGKDTGDELGRSSLLGGPKITPAGQFGLFVDEAEYAGGKSLNLRETLDAEDGSYVAVHAAYLGDAKERRGERLKSPSAEDNKISYGCVNTAHDTFLDKVLPNIENFNGGMIFVLPDATEKTAEMFPAQVEEVTKTITESAQAPTPENRKLAAREELVGKEEKVEAIAPKTVAMQYTTATRTESNPAVREAVQDGRLTEALDRLAVEGANDLIRQVAKELSPLVMRTKVRMDPNLTVDGVAVPAAFGVDTNTIMFRPTEISDEDIIHEATHAATMRVLRMPEAELTPRQLAAKKELESIYGKLKKDTALEKEYGLKDVEEFVSEVQSNVEFRAAINKQPWYRQLWNAILRLFSKAPAEAISERASRLVRDIYLPSKKIETTAATTVPSVFRTTKPKYESENALTELADRVIAQPKNFGERMGSNLALEAEMNAVDMRAAVQEFLKRGAKEMGDDNLFTQAMYNVRKADQYMPIVYSTLTNGPQKFYTDEKGLRGVTSTNENPASDIFEAVKNVPGKNTEAKFALASTYMIAQRAANKGLSKLDLGALGLNEADLAAAMAAVDADPVLKDALEEVRRKYNAYNEGQIKFLADAGKISKADAKAWLKDGDYVPYYRVREDGTAELVFGGEKTLTIGDIRTQPYLAELKGGDSKILPLNESLIRNTMLITKAALYNNATKEIAYAMQTFGEGKGEIDPKTGKAKNSMPIQKGSGPAGSDVIRFNQEPDPKDPKDDGKRWLRVNTKNTAMEGIPSELVVKSLEGAHLTLPAFLKIGGIAGDWLRKGVTRMPPYIFRQLIRDPMAASFTGGLNYGPFRAVVMAGTEFLRSSVGRSELNKKLIEKGLVQSGVFSGDPDDMSTFATQLASGKDGPAIDRLMGLLDRAAMRADAATRGLVYENAKKNGLSEVEADMMTMESMNFYKRGLSPTVQYANRLIPFMNAQIQGLNVLAKAMRGNMPFEERQRIQRKFWNNAVMLFGVGLVYAFAMDDDETFKNAKPRDKYTNFFVNLPGVSEAIKVPLPYESGWFFSAAVALADAMKEEVNGKQQLKALRDMFLSSVPGYSSMFMPQAIKPLLEVFTNKNFFSGQNIESVAMQSRSPEARFNAATTEAAKAMGKVLPLSPVQIEHLARGYFGTAPLALMSAASGFMRSEEKGEAPERRLSETPILGTVFQRKYGGADADTMYAFAKEATQRAATLKDMQKTGTPQEQKEYLAQHRAEIKLAPMARNFETLMGRIRTQEDVVRNRKDFSAEEKRKRLDELDRVKQDLANKFNAAVRRAEAQAS